MDQSQLITFSKEENKTIQCTELYISGRNVNKIYFITSNNEDWIKECEKVSILQGQQKHITSNELKDAVIAGTSLPYCQEQHSSQPWEIRKKTTRSSRNQEEKNRLNDLLKYSNLHREVVVVKGTSIIFFKEESPYYDYVRKETITMEEWNERIKRETILKETKEDRSQQSNISQAVFSPIDNTDMNRTPDQSVINEDDTINWDYFDKQIKLAVEAMEADPTSMVALLNERTAQAAGKLKVSNTGSMSRRNNDIGVKIEHVRRRPF